MPVYPGDPKFTREIRRAKESLGRTSYQTWTLGNHNGTHIDYPAHFFEEGANSNFYEDVDDFEMQGTLFNLRGMGSVINQQAVEKIKDVNGALLLYTGFIELAGLNGYKDNDFPYLTPLAAQTILDNNPKLRRLGIDSFSVDSRDSLGVHKLILYNKVPIIEGLTNLSQLYDSIDKRKDSFTFHCVPLKVDRADAVLVRAYAEI